MTKEDAAFYEMPFEYVRNMSGRNETRIIASPIAEMVAFMHEPGLQCAQR